MRFEYRWASVSTEQLNRLGAEGWEAVGVSDDVSSDANHDITTESSVLMKRRADLPTEQPMKVQMREYKPGDTFRL